MYRWPWGLRYERVQKPFRVSERGGGKHSECAARHSGSTESMGRVCAQEPGQDRSARDVTLQNSRRSRRYRAGVSPCLQTRLPAVGWLHCTRHWLLSHTLWLPTPLCNMTLPKKHCWIGILEQLALLKEVELRGRTCFYLKQLKKCWLKIFKM